MTLRSFHSQMEDFEDISSLVKDISGYIDKELSEYAKNQKVKIAIVGLGNAGANMAKNVAHLGKIDADIYVVDTDASHLLYIKREHLIINLLEEIRVRLLSGELKDIDEIKKFIIQGLMESGLFEKEDQRVISATIARIMARVQKMMKEELEDPHASNPQKLEKKITPIKVHLLGAKRTRGQGTGNDPKKSYTAVMDPNQDRAFFEEILRNVDMVIILAGLGGGTGTGAAPAVAKLARTMKYDAPTGERHEPLIISIVTIPFKFELEKKKKQALVGLSELFKYSHSVIVVENDAIKDLYGKHEVREAFRMADITIAHVASGLVRMLNSDLEFNVDFADLYRLMYNSKMSYIGIGESDSNDMAAESVKKAISHPLITKSMLLEKSKAKGAIIFYEVPPTSGIGRENIFTTEKFEQASWLVSNLVDEKGMVKWAIDFDVEDTCWRDRNGEKRCAMRTLVVIAGVKSKYEELAAEAEKEVGGFEKFIQTYTRPATESEETIIQLFEAL